MTCLRYLSTNALICKESIQLFFKGYVSLGCFYKHAIRLLIFVISMPISWLGSYIASPIKARYEKSCMKKAVLGLLLFFFSDLMSAQQNVDDACSKWPGWFQGSCRRLHQIWYEGSNDLYVSGYAWHNRFTYPSYKIATYNEMAWGGGLGKGFYDEQGDWHALVAIGFLDSHKNLQPAAGYAYQKMSYLNQAMGIGGGFAVLLTMRQDIFHGIPFPGVLPLLSLHYKNAGLYLTYIPGSGRVGNVLFIFGKLTLAGW